MSERNGVGAGGSLVDHAASVVVEIQRGPRPGALGTRVFVNDSMYDSPVAMVATARTESHPANPSVLV